MADDDEEVVVTIGDGALTGDAVTTDDPAKILEQQYKDLQADTERERSARKAADAKAARAVADADHARREATSARADVIDSQYDTVATGLASAQAEAAAAEAEYAAAFEKGDALAMAKAQRKIANAEARSVRLDEAKAELEVRKREPRRAEREPQRERAQTAQDDPVESYLAGRSAPTQKWLRAHTEWITDARKNAKLTAAHMDAVAEGLEADTADYFDHVETFIGLRKQQNGNGRDATNTTTQPKRKTSVPAAPVHQSSGGTNGGSREVRLTPGEARAAQDGTHVWNYDDSSPQKKFRKGDPIGIQEFARRKEALTKQGAYDRSYVEQ